MNLCGHRKTDRSWNWEESSTSFMPSILLLPASNPTCSQQGKDRGVVCRASVQGHRSGSTRVNAAMRDRRKYSARAEINQLEKIKKEYNESKNLEAGSLKK